MGPETILSTSHSPALCRVGSPAANGLHIWLASKSYAVTADEATIKLHPRSFDTALEHWASDTARLLSAGRETLSLIYKSKYPGKSIAWALIQSYYAAFYYAHVILRLSRQSITYTSTSNLLNLRRACDAAGLNIPFRLNTNQYIIKLSDINKSFTLSQKTNGDGTHESLWQEFLHLIDASVDQSKTLFPDYEDDIKETQKKLVSAVKCSSGETGYISSFRNQIQYTQMHGAWHPYASTLPIKECRDMCGSIMSGKAEINNFNIASNDSATKFAHSSLLICWAGEMLIRSIGSDKKSFLYSSRLPPY